MTTGIRKVPFRWVPLAPLKYQRLGAVATVLPDGRVLVQGGQFTDDARNNKTVYPPDEVWNPRTNTWNPSGKIRPAPCKDVEWTHAPTLTPLGDGRILVTGGKEEGYNAGPFEIDPQPEAAAFVIEMGSKKRMPAGRVCVARWMHATAVLDDGSVLLIGGADNQGAAIADVEIGLPPDFSKSKVLAALVAGFQELLRLQDCNALIAASARARHEKRHDAALKLVRQALALTPRHQDAWQELGYVYSASGRHEEALVEYQRLLFGDRKSPFLWYFIACTNLQLNRRREALEAYGKVVELVEADGEDFTTQRLHGEARKQRQFLTIELDGPEAGLKVTGPLDTLSTEEWNNRGLALHQQGKHAQALPCFDRALSLDPSNDYALHNQGVVLLQLRRPQEALAALEICIALRGDRAAGSLINLGIAHYDLGNFAASVEDYDRALKLKPERSQAVMTWTNRGNSLLKLKKFAQAGKSYGKALELDPKYATAWHGRVCVASAQRRYSDADTAMKKLLKLAPTMEPELRRDKDLRAYWAWKDKR